MDYTKLPNYKAAVEKYTNAVKEGADEAAQSKAFDKMMNTLGTEMMENMSASTSNKINELMASRSTNGLSENETKFFNDITSGVGNPEVTLPLEIMNQVFQELQNAHPLLDIIKFQSAGLKMRATIADSIYDGGTAVWGEVFDDIKGQLKQAFHEVDFSQSKLTAFVAIPKDALENGYDWLKSFIIIQMSEAMAVALETALVAGDGDKKPIGLMKDLSKGAISNGVTTYPDKDVFADWSDIDPKNAATKIAPVMQALSKNEKEITVNISGQVKMLVNPDDYYSTLAKFMYLTDNGVWVTVLPFGVEIIQCIAVPVGKAVIFAANRYWAYMGGTKMQEFDQTFALEDLQLYTVKAFYYGKAYDNNTAQVVTLASTPK
ncbi:phage major capsid protein [Lactococcus lactis]|uniref:phage major capsid protein n=1 Tax=Lactococcus lactis TaxID=1358 RepID=UPI001D0795A8|nr:phage major capsid protein [Lactococcus lactis]MCB6852186.1 phage major capsid protein [Lactococcus lactis]BDH81181.1 phage major capsid protein [Lactococcus lactis]